MYIRFLRIMMERILEFV